MKTALNGPLDDLNMNVGAMKLASARLATESAEYREYLRSGDRYVILDGSSHILGEPVSLDELGDLMDALQPDEVVLPYSPKNREATYDLSMDFFNDHVVGARKRPKIMAVAQGASRDDWMSSYIAWADLEYVDVIGVTRDVDFSVAQAEISKDMPSAPESRSFNRRRLIDHLYYQFAKKPIHLIGMNSLGEVDILRDSGANKKGFIRSIGTTAPFAAAVQGMEWSAFAEADRHTEEGINHLDYDHKWSHETKARAYRNLMTFAEATGDHSVSYNLGRIANDDEVIQPKEEQ